MCIWIKNFKIVQVYGILHKLIIELILLYNVSSFKCELQILSKEMITNR